jgi:ComF family protein
MLYTFLLPYHCVLCKAPSDQTRDLCKTCEADLPYLKHACVQCANPLPLSEYYCGQCLKKPPAFQHTFALCYYENPFSHLITQLKFNAQLGLGRLLGNLMADHLKKQNIRIPDLLIPIPLHKKRLRERGFNQALEIARPISKSLHIPLDITRCQRIRHTAAQSDTPFKERYRNIRRAFQIHGTLPEHVAIIDDVMTTGNTVNELAAALKHAGVKQIQVWCCARTRSGK